MVIGYVFFFSALVQNMGFDPTKSRAAAWVPETAAPLHLRSSYVDTKNGQLVIRKKKHKQKKQRLATA